MTNFPSNGWERLIVEKHVNEMGETVAFVAVEEWRAPKLNGEVLLKIACRWEVSSYSHTSNPEEVARRYAEKYVETRAKAKADGHPSISVVSGVMVPAQEDHRHEVEWNRTYENWQCPCGLVVAEHDGRYIRPEYHKKDDPPITPL